MKRHLFTPFSPRVQPLVAALSCTLGGALIATSAFAGGGASISTHIIKVETNGAEVIEADVSNLELGESVDFVTESGQVIDILKAPEGFEIYIDGELLEPNGAHGDLERLHKHISIHEEQLEIDCDGSDPDACEAQVEAIVSGDFDHAEVIVARREVTEVCDEDGNCDASVWISSDADVPVHVLGDGQDKRVIVIEKTVEGELY